MPDHTVTIRLPGLQVGYSDAEFIVYSGEDRFGRLKVSQGGVDWLPKDAKKPRKMSWEMLDRVLRKEWGEL